jgi:thiol-disulfide isomerase/thioredoxin
MQAPRAPAPLAPGLSYPPAVRPLRFVLVTVLAFTLGACAQEKPQPVVSATRDSTQVVFAAVTPDSLAQVIAASGGKATIVNVWASWCEPCREEFPEIVRLRRDYEKDGLRVVFVSADFTEALPDARKFLAAQGVDWPTWYKTGGDQAFIDALSPKWTGALPGTFVYDAQGKLRDFWEGKASYARFEASVKPLLFATTRKEDKT